MRSICIILLLCCFTHLVHAQQSSLLVKLDKAGAPYLDHTIGAKENFYSIGRIYNISPRVYAPYNNIDLNAPLSIGQVIRIPLNEVNFYQGGSSNENEVFVPLYHVVKAGENLPRIADAYRADKDRLTTWNNLTSQSVKAGQRLIIGYLKVDKNLSSLASMAQSVKSAAPIKTETLPVAVVAEKKAEPVVEKQTELPKTIAAVEAATQETSVTMYGGSGFFMEEYNRQTNNGKLAGEQQRFNAGVFKSNSGWSDGKYYVLLEGVEKGTIVQIINLANGKSVYAKVIAGVQETSGESDLQLRISNAAASQLGISASNFEVALRWAN